MNFVMSEILKKEKEVKVIDNTQWKERHQFVLSANGNIICQRYFKVNGFNPKSLNSEELYYTIRDIVHMIKDDLKSKSRIYTAITMGKSTKLTGFYNGEKLSNHDAALVFQDDVRGEVTLSNGIVLNKTYIDYDVEEEVDDSPFTLKFSYLFDDKAVYEEVWDGTVYPKYVRNCIDLSNSNVSYKNVDPMRMTFSQQMTKSLNSGRPDLIYNIIKLFCDTLSNDVDDDGNSIDKGYTTSVKYGNKKYYYTNYPIDFVKGWAAAVRQKTNAYNRWSDRHLSQSKFDYVNRHM
nr:MAG TPA: hypothetical protein [Caudoviricetes sp.]